MKYALLLLIITVLLVPSLWGQIGFDVILVGRAPRSVFEAEQLFPWYNFAYQSYVPESETVEKIKAIAAHTKFLVFVGTWCSDTKRELPRFLKVADSAGIAPEAIELVFLDRDKKAKDKSPEENKVVNIPTIILLSEGKELGRIVENTQKSMEKDLLQILTTQTP
jgi:thiol-disulfide isomerase/thioredoxin